MIVAGSGWLKGLLTVTLTARSPPRGSSKRSPVTCTASNHSRPPAKSLTCSTHGPTAATSLRCAGSPVLCAAGKTKSLPGTPPAELATAPPKQSTLRSNRSNASDEDSQTSTTTAYGSSFTAAASHGNIHPPRGSEPAVHDSWRRPPLPG